VNSFLLPSFRWSLEFVNLVIPCSIHWGAILRCGLSISLQSLFLKQHRYCLLKILKIFKKGPAAESYNSDFSLWIMTKVFPRGCSRPTVQISKFMNTALLSVAGHKAHIVAEFIDRLCVIFGRYWGPKKGDQSRRPRSSWRRRARG
jgi:hypothetical protein